MSMKRENWQVYSTEESSVLVEETHKRTRLVLISDDEDDSSTEEEAEEPPSKSVGKVSCTVPLNFFKLKKEPNHQTNTVQKQSGPPRVLFKPEPLAVGDKTTHQNNHTPTDKTKHGKTKKEPAASSLARPFSMKREFKREAEMNNSSAVVESYHIVFVVDKSGSMRKRDVKVPDSSTPITRQKAVFNCISGFVQNQLHEPCAASDIYSLLSFNHTTQVHFSGEKMDNSLLKSIRKTEKNMRPHRETEYGQSLDYISDVCKAVPCKNHCVIFLSDGKPGDIKIKNTFSERSKKLFKNKVGIDSIVFHTLGFGKEDFQVLKMMATTMNGSFSRAGLDSSVLKRAMTSIATTITTMRTTSDRRPSKLLNIEFETPSAYKEDSIRGWKKYSACMMRYNTGTHKWESLSKSGDNLIIRLRKRPFARGGQRHVFHMFVKEDSKELHLIVKESSSVERYSNRLGFHKDSYLAQQEASRLAVIFNKEIFRKVPEYATKAIVIIPSIVIRIRDEEASGGFRYLLAEKFLPGNYRKLTSNNGYVNHTDRDVELALAFSHFSYVHTNGKSMVCDIQGVGLQWTDTQLHSVNFSYGPSDLGKRGFNSFFKTYDYKKNYIAQKLGLPNPFPTVG